MNRSLLIGVGMWLVCLVLVCLGDLRYHLHLFLALYLLLFILMLAAWRLGSATSNLPLILFFGIVFRLTLLPAMPSLSDDIYRYDWEGRVQRAGWSPYEYPPSAPELFGLRDAIYPLINHKDVPTLYPPLTQLIFRIGSYGRTVLGWAHVSVIRSAVFSQKLLFVLFDIVAMFLLLALLRLRHLSETSLILYAWNPLVLLEFSGSGHNDSLALCCLLAGLVAWEKGQSFRASFALAAAFLGKYISVLLLPFFLWKRRWREVMLWILTVTAGMVPFCLCWVMTKGAHQYAGRWQFNGSLFVALSWLLPKGPWPKWTAAALLGSYALVKGIRAQDLVSLTRSVIMAALLLAPDVHPWYFIWVVPFLCVQPAASWLFWNCTLGLSYTVWHRFMWYHVWDLHPAIQAIEYVPFYLWFLYESRNYYSRAQRV